MIAQLVAAFVIVVMAVALAPVILNQVSTMQSSNMTSAFDMGPTSTIVTIFPFILGALVLMIVIPMIISALRSGGLMGGGRGVDSDYKESEDEEEEEEDEEDEDDDDDYEDDDEEEEEEEEEPPKEKTRSTVVTTRKKFGTKDGEVIRTNVKFGPGYNVDKYALDPVKETKLTMKEDNFKKTRFD